MCLGANRTDFPGVQFHSGKHSRVHQPKILQIDLEEMYSVVNLVKCMITDCVRNRHERSLAAGNHTAPFTGDSSCAMGHLVATKTTIGL
jgi:hypothetical protein